MPLTLSHPVTPDKGQNRAACELGPDGHVIVQVLAGTLSATDAASELDVTRQTVHRQLNRARAGINEALTPAKPGPKPAEAQESEQLAAAYRKNEDQRREILALKAVQLLLLALFNAAGLLPDFRHLRLSAAQKLSLIEWMDAFVAAGGTAKAFATTIGQNYTKLLSWRKRIRGLSHDDARRALTDKSSAAAHERLPDGVIQAVIAMKRKHPSWSAQQISRQLARQRRPIQVGKTSVWEILRKHNPGEPPDRARRRKLHTFAEKGVAFCVDFMHVNVGLSSMKVCLVIDEATRYIVAWSVTRKTSSDLVFNLIRYAARRFGQPLMVKSDNGPEFRASFAANLAAQRIFHLPSPRYYAPFNGKIERVFRKLRRFLRFAPIPVGIWALRRLVDGFVKEHNTLHTNENLGGITPHEALALGGPIALPDTTERIRVRREGDSLIFHFTNRRDQPARKELSLT